jgi:phytoene dehydrogenase-like protein
MVGLRVRVLERRGVVGGACVTEEFHPGFRNSTAAYTVGLLQPEIIRDLKLNEHGLRIVNRRAQNFLPLPDGRYLLAGGRAAPSVRSQNSASEMPLATPTTRSRSAASPTSSAALCSGRRPIW